MLDPHSELVTDFQDSEFFKFTDSCWVLLTNPRPPQAPVDYSWSSHETPSLLDLKSANKKRQLGSQFGKRLEMRKMSFEEALPDSKRDQVLKSKYSDDIEESSNQSTFKHPKIGQKVSQILKKEGPNMRSTTLEKQSGMGGLTMMQPHFSNSLLPQKRYGHSACIVGSNMYVFGGASKKGGGQSHFYPFYSCQLRLGAQREDLFKWRRMQIYSPISRDSHSCVVFQDQLLVFGGSSESKCHNDILKFNTKTKLWTQLETISDLGHQPTPREGHVALLTPDGSKMWVHGGINEQQICFEDSYVLVGLHQEIDAVQSEVKLSEDGHVTNVEELKGGRGRNQMLRWYRCRHTGQVAVGRDSHSGTVAGNYIYLFGGQDNEENIQDDFYRVLIKQETDGEEEVVDGNSRVKQPRLGFVVEWVKIELRRLDPEKQIPWPLKRSSHSMNLFLNRFLVLVGGETTNDGQLSHPLKKKMIKAKLQEQKQGEDGKDTSPEQAMSRSLNDVWVFDLLMSRWWEVTPSVKVQPSFNNRKQRKIFEARMAHSTVVIDNYLVVFGGYSPQENQFMHANLNILSLSGCTDYMLAQQMTISMCYERMVQRRLGKDGESDVKIRETRQSDKSHSQRQQTERDKVQLSIKDKTLSLIGKRKINTDFECSSETRKVQKTDSVLNNDVKRKDKLKSEFQETESKVLSRQGNKRGTDCGMQTDYLSNEQLDNEYRNDHRRHLFQRSLAHKKEFSLMNSVAQQIKNPLQLIAHMVKIQISTYQSYFTLSETGESTKVLANIEQFPPLSINISLPKSHVHNSQILRIQDNGPGISFSQLKELLSGDSRLDKNAWLERGPEGGSKRTFQLGALKLAKNTLLISKTISLKQKMPATESSYQEKFVEEVHVGLLSVNFIKDSGSKYIVAPMVSFRIQRRPNKEEGEPGYEKMSVEQLSEVILKRYELVAVTPLPEKFTNLILQYTGIFENYETMKEWILLDVFEPSSNSNIASDQHFRFVTGTDIFLCELNQPYLLHHSDILLLDSHSNQDFFPLDLEHSLATQLRFLYVDFPQNVSLSIDGQKLPSQNPFDEIASLFKGDSQFDIRVKNDIYNFWVITDSKLRELGVPDEAIYSLQGVLVYKPEEWDLSNFDLSKIDQEMLNMLLLYPNYQFVKRLDLPSFRFTEIVRDGQQVEKEERLYGIVGVNIDCSMAELTIDLQDFMRKNLEMALLQDISSSYKEWRTRNNPSTVFNDLQSQQSYPQAKILAIPDSNQQNNLLLMEPQLKQKKVEVEQEEMEGFKSLKLTQTQFNQLSKENQEDYLKRLVDDKKFKKFISIIENHQMSSGGEGTNSEKPDDGSLKKREEEQREHGLW